LNARHFENYHELVKAFSFGLLVLVVFAGCGRGGRVREFPVLDSVTTVAVKGRGSPYLFQITDGQAVSRIVAFVDSHRTGWEKPWYGTPVPVATAEFYSGTDFKGSFGVGENFLEAQRDGGFFSQNAAPAEVRRFLDLLDPMGTGGERGRILDGDFTPVRSVDLVPPQVKAAFAALTRESRFEMADKGQDFQLTDVISKRGLPRRRMILAGISDTTCFLHYEMGGRGHAYYLVVFTTNSSGAMFVWGGSVPEPSATITQLRFSARVSANVPSSDLAF
jgi:hypothetical protein